MRLCIYGNIELRPVLDKYMIRYSLTALLIVASLTPAAAAASTLVTVRAISRDAKVIGDNVGGARITIRDVVTGKILASGIQQGGTGDTKLIMQTPRTRGAIVYGSEGAAAFRATLELTKPTRVEIIAEGPLKYPQAMQRVSKTMLLLPGQNIEGDGVLLEISGFIVEIVAPKNVQAEVPVSIRAKVTMTCGCPTDPGGMWNADDVTVMARAIRAGKTVGEVRMRYAGETSAYEGTLPDLTAGNYELEVIASDSKTANAGRAAQPMILRSEASR